MHAFKDNQQTSFFERNAFCNILDALFCKQKKVDEGVVQEHLLKGVHGHQRDRQRKGNSVFLSCHVHKLFKASIPSISFKLSLDIYPIKLPFFKLVEDAMLVGLYCIVFKQDMACVNKEYIFITRKQKSGITFIGFCMSKDFF